MRINFTILFKIVEPRRKTFPATSGYEITYATTKRNECNPTFYRKYDIIFPNSLMDMTALKWHFLLAHYKSDKIYYTIETQNKFLAEKYKIKIKTTVIIQPLRKIHLICWWTWYSVLRIIPLLRMKAVILRQLWSQNKTFKSIRRNY